MRAKDLADHAFARLEHLIEAGRIRPGSDDERTFLKRELELSLFNAFKMSGVEFFPEVKIHWDPVNPDDLAIQLSDKTITVARGIGLI